MNTRWGTSANAQGHFSLTIPDSLRGRSITFVHLSYETYTVPVDELVKELAAARKNGEELKVVLTDYSHPLGTVVVTAKNTQWSRVKNLNSRGIPAPLLWFTLYQRPSRLMDPEETKRMEETGIQAGVLLQLKRETRLRDIELNELWNDFDTLILRVVVYRKDGSDFTPLMKAPLYIHVTKGRKLAIKADLSSYEIRTQGTVYVGVESVEIKGKGFVSTKAYRGGNGYFFNPSTEENRKAYSGFGFGLVVRGSVLR